MEEEATSSGMAMHVTRGCLVVPVQVELSDDLMLRIQEDILERVSRTGVKGVVIDVSGAGIIDSFLGRMLCDTGRMASLLGAATVVTGLRPEIVASLVDLDFELKGIQTALPLEDGLRKVGPTAMPIEEAEELEEPEGELEGIEGSEDEIEDGNGYDNE